MNWLLTFFGPETWWIGVTAVLVSGAGLAIWVRRAPRTRAQLWEAAGLAIVGAVALMYLISVFILLWACNHGDCV